MIVDPESFVPPALLVAGARGEAVEYLARLPVSRVLRRRAAIAWARRVDVELFNWELEFIERGIGSAARAN